MRSGLVVGGGFLGDSLTGRPYKGHMGNTPPLPIVTPRFLLREYLTTDETAFVRYQTDPDFTIHHSAEELGDDHARHVFRLFMAWQKERPRKRYQLAVCHRADGDRLIGSCGVRREGSAEDEAEFGIELAQLYWGRYGFAVEISNAMIEWAFLHLRVVALTAGTAPGNAVAARLAERAGFERTGAGDKQFWRLDRKHWKPAKI